MVDSWLWQLDRAMKFGQSPLLRPARDDCEEALRWLTEDGSGASAEVTTEWLTSDALGLRVTMSSPRTPRSSLQGLLGLGTPVG
ncbi:phage GP46 family protein [Belnapia moabensis]|uniref:phage GP46 family protein n=1 Tax=Belnapia moabensis TaxID=365533 RepID=UPI0038CDBB13